MSLTLGAETIPLKQDPNGTIRVGQTRVTLESVAYCFQEGASPEAIVEAFPALSLADLYLVLGYCLRHPDELKSYLEQQRATSQEIRREDELRLGLVGIQQRLLERQGQLNGK